MKDTVIRTGILLGGSTLLIMSIVALGGSARPLSGALFGVVSSQATAATGMHFGGTISKVTYCPCAYDFAIILTIKDKVKGEISLKYSPFYSMIRSSYNIWEPGPWVLGGYGPGYTQCLRQSGYYCTNNSQAPSNISGVIDTIRGIGTSLYGSGK